MSGKWLCVDGEYPADHDKRCAKEQATKDIADAAMAETEAELAHAEAQANGTGESGLVRIELARTLRQQACRRAKEGR